MIFSRRILLSVCYSFAAFALCAAAAEPTTQPIDEAIAHLGDPDPAVREQAAMALQEAGPSARLALQAAAEGGDPEIAARARKLLRAVAAVPQTKPAEADDALPVMYQYRITQQEGKRAKIIEMSTTAEGLRALTRLWMTEPQPDLRDAIFVQLLSELNSSASSLLADGNVATAELLLQAAVDRKTADAQRSYAAYWLSRGKLEVPIRKWASRGDQKPVDPWAERILCALYRASGDAKSAIAHARSANDADELRDTLLWAGDWSALAGALRHTAAAAQEPRELALLSGADALAGDSKALDADVAKLTALAQGEEPAGAAGDILLMLNRPDEAVRVFVDAKLYYAAYEVLSDRGKFDDAAALLAAHDAETTQEAMMLRASAARTFVHLGLKKQCAEMSARIEKENAVDKFSRVYVALAEAERAAGMSDKSWEHFLAPIELMSKSQQDYRWYVIRAFPPKTDEINWSGIWWASLFRNPQRPIAALFDRIRRAYDGSMPTGDLADALKGVDLSNEVFRPYEDLIWDTARRMRAEGHEADGDALVTTLAAHSEDGDLYIRLGDLAAEKKDWPKAAGYYETAWKKERTQPLPLYLQGWALEQGGQIDDGHEKMALAHQLPVGDELRRAELVRGLLSRGLDQAAAREADVLIRTGTPVSSSFAEALHAAAAFADDRGDFATGVALWQRVTAAYLSGSYWFGNHSLYLHLPNAARSSHARALIVAGDLAGAQGEIETSLQSMPIDSAMVIDAVATLDAAGKRAEADALFDKMFSIEESVCEKFPDSTYQLNECAWLAAKSHRELDKAIAHARRAVDLDPLKGVEAIDTLAEAYFQHGDFEKAVAEEKRCVELAPNVIFHRRQLARFEAGHK